jgi:uncharacterized protein with HEPN domain
MLPEKLYLVDIIEAADAVRRFCESISEEDFKTDELHQSAILQN